MSAFQELSLRLFTRRNAQLNTTKSVATLSRIDVTLLRKRSAQRELRLSARLSTRSSVRLFKMRSVKMFLLSNVVSSMIDSAPRFPKRNAG